MDLNKEFEGRAVFVAGASGGIGRVAARMLLERGANVLLHYRTNADALKELHSLYGPGRVRLTQGDLTTAAEIERMVAECEETFGKIDAFLSTVGTSLHIRPFLTTPIEDVERTIAVELRSVITCMRAVLPGLIRNGGGQVVFVGSDSGKVGTSGESVSAACRGGLISFCKSIAREYARQKILVNVVCPGPTETALWEDLVENDEFGRKIGNAMVRAIPLRRTAQPAEVASAAVFLVSPQASFITGQAISVSGGLTMS
jgi:2-hydroxycyclohexanecarboxyl-CoA dehydrogenase